jgi:hypothetical protein
MREPTEGILSDDGRWRRVDLGGLSAIWVIGIRGHGYPARGILDQGVKGSACYRICYRPELRGLAHSWPKRPESDSRKERLPETSEGVQRKA